jgi:hypothetical protein
MAAVVGYIVSALAIGWIVLAPGLALVRLAETAPLGRARTWLAAWPVGYAVSAPILYIAGRVFGFGGITSIVAAGAAAAALAVLTRWLRGRPALSPAARLPRWAVAGIVLAAITLATSYLEFSRGSDYVTNAVSDWNERQAAVWALRHDGLPMIDPLFHPGRNVPMYYPAGPYLAVAAAVEAGGGAAPDGWPYAILMAGMFVSLSLLAAEAAARQFGSARAGVWAAVLVVTGGLHLVVVAGWLVTGRAVNFGHIGAWAPSEQLRIDGLYEGALYAVPHLAPLLAGLVLFQWLPLDVRRRPGSVVAAALVGAGLVYLSPYSAVAVAAVIGLYWLIQAMARRWRRWLWHGAGLLAAGALAAALVVPWVIDIRAADVSGSGKLVVGLPAPSIRPISSLTGAWAEPLDLVLQLALQLLPVIALGLAGWRLSRATHRTPLAGLLGWTIPITLGLIAFIQSPGWNIWGLRTAHLIQIAGAILGGGWMAWATAARSRWRYLAWAGIFVGLGATAWEIGTKDLGHFVVVRPADRGELHEAAAFIDLHTPADAVVMIDPQIDGALTARRWSNRRALLANQNHGSRLFCDPADLARVTGRVKEVSKTGLGSGAIASLQAEGATLALVRTDALRPDVPPDRLLYRTTHFAVVELRPLSRAGPASSGIP